MRRKQLYLDEETDRAFKRVAVRTGRSEAWHIREALRSYLGNEARTSADPLERLIGLVEDENGAKDMAVNHDHYLYGAPRDRS